MEIMCIVQDSFNSILILLWGIASVTLMMVCPQLTQTDLRNKFEF